MKIFYFHMTALVAIVLALGVVEAQDPAPAPLSIFAFFSAPFINALVTFVQGIAGPQAAADLGGFFETVVPGYTVPDGLLDPVVDGTMSMFPSLAPSNIPSTVPSSAPLAAPSSMPSLKPSMEPSKSNAPTSDSEEPSSNPTESAVPSTVPSMAPSTVPSGIPSTMPSLDPTKSFVPTEEPDTIQFGDFLCGGLNELFARQACTCTAGEATITDISNGLEATIDASTSCSSDSQVLFVPGIAPSTVQCTSDYGFAGEVTVDNSQIVPDVGINGEIIVNATCTSTAMFASGVGIGVVLGLNATVDFESTEAGVSATVDNACSAGLSITVAGVTVVATCGCNSAMCEDLEYNYICTVVEPFLGTLLTFEGVCVSVTSFPVDVQLPTVP